MDKIKWGIIGCGNIAGKFTEGLKTLQDAELTAVASRTPGKAEAFAERFSVDTCYDTYEALLADEDVDVVYVATTHNFHYENVLLCLEHGKHVLCEKVFTINSRQARHLRDLAKSRGLFLMEAMWTRFLPAVREIRKLIDTGVIGEVMFMEAEFSHIWPVDMANRFYNMQLAGGSLLDQGIYPISFASMIFGQNPKTLTSNGCKASTGVDIRSTHLFDYGNGKAAVLSSSIAYYDRIHAVIGGTKGSMEIPDFFLASKFTLHIDEKVLEYDLPFEGYGKHYQAQEVMDCIRDGKLQSDIMPADESVSIMETLDEIRSQLVLAYPEEMEMCTEHTGKAGTE